MSKTTNPKLSIVIVNWNGKNRIGKCLDSLFNQDFDDFQVIIVDNGSTDNSVEFIKSNYPKCKVILNEANVGFAKGNNVGIKNAKSEYILLLNNDTWVKQNFLSTMVSYIENNSFDVISAYEATYDNEIPFPRTTKLDLLGYPIHLKADKKNGKPFYLTGVCLLFKKTLYDETGGLDSDFFMYFEETDWFWRLLLYGKTFNYLDNIYVYHEGIKSRHDIFSVKTFLWRNQNNLQMLLKNYSALSLLLILPIYIIFNFVEMLFLMLIGKPRIAFTYLEGWFYNIRNFRKTMRKRKIIQHSRIVNELFILSRMYIGFAKPMHFIRLIKEKI